MNQPDPVNEIRGIGCDRLSGDFLGALEVALLHRELLRPPPKVSGEKPWHQDAAYFRGSDPNLMFGVWMALDPATRENGCMEVIPASHLRGPAPHVPAEDINSAPSGLIWSTCGIAWPCR